MRLEWLIGAAAATEQSSATDEVNNNESEIAKISLDTSSGARQSARACEALSELALDLNQLISKFRVGGDQESFDLTSSVHYDQNEPYAGAQPTGGLIHSGVGAR